MNRKNVPDEIWKKASLIIGCSKCNFFIWVQKGDKWQEEKEALFKDLVEKGKLECPICKSEMNVVIDVENGN